MDMNRPPIDPMDINRDNERYLPIANINRIMKKSLPENAKISKDAKQTIQECVTEFIFFITSEACERCKVEKRKTISGEDLLHAISQLGFDEYYEPLRVYLVAYREWSERNEATQRPQREEEQEQETIINYQKDDSDKEQEDDYTMLGK